MSALQPAPLSLVENGVRRYGRFAARPANVNPKDEFGGPFGALKRFRLKEWVGFTLVHPDWYASLILQDAQYLASSEIYAASRRSGALHQHAANALGGSLALPAVLAGSRCAIERPGYAISYDFAPEGGAAHRVTLDIAATKTAPAFSGTLTLDARGASAPLSVSARLPGGQMYTHKAIFPASGRLTVGGEEIVFDGACDFAILDEHKSFLPYRTEWLWGTFALRAEGGIAGANFAARPSVPGAEEESCIWAGGACEPLADISFEPKGAGKDAPWRIASRDGRLDVVFEPEGRKAVRHQLGLFAIDYFQMFGRYRGTLRGAGRAIALNGVHGVCESMRARL